MKRNLWCGVLLLIPTVAAAQSATNAERDVLAALQKLGQAQAECQVAAQAALRVPDHLVIGPSGAIATADQLTTSGQNCQPRKPPTDEDLRVRIYNGDTAIVTGLNVLYRPDGTPLPKRRFTSVWVKIDGAWKHANYQATPVVEGATPR